MNRNRVRVLYIWNTAGALTPVANWLSKNGHKARIVMGAWFYKWGYASDSDIMAMVEKPANFFSVVRQEIRKFKPTHIHVNSSISGLVIARAMCPFIPILFHYHGTDVRGRLYPHARVKFLADKSMVSTPDLKMYAEWWGCPVEEIFTYRGGREPRTAVTILSPSVHFDFENQAKKYAKMKNLKLTIIDCRKGEQVPHEELPEFLSKFEYYLDFKGVRIPGALSLIGKEAYTVGCKVIHDSDLSKAVDDFIEKTPEDYLNLYLSLKSPSMLKTAARLAYCLPRAYLLK